ncbi:hypothetical protein [Actinomadura roseirufa]|uniref:hypothetical protein n=1 Tax=Actinomadura roseirufa TaxID=2094049 RepID=UPI001040E372|nr:hypothetical protein [Actinomadura roseirufa]
MSYVAPWAGVTTLAVTLSWLGVRGVVRDTLSERAAPIAGPVIHASPSILPGQTSIGSPAVRPGPAAGVDQGPRPTPTPARSPKSSPKPTGRPPRPPGPVRSYATLGGQAAMAFSNGRVRLVSATPNPGYETRVTETSWLLRVDFLTERHTSSVIASWYQHPPTVSLYEY